VRVERIGTAAMSRQHHEQAVTALAALIAAWWHSHACQPDEDPASPLPLPGPASDTDHAERRLPRSPPGHESYAMTHARAPQPGTAGRGGDVGVGIYVRRSTDDEHQPYSIEAQDTRLAAYIGSQPGWRQAARFTDDAGATTVRPGLHRALAAARAGPIDVLQVYRVDRLTAASAIS
jgi:Resolvase, N terminal domain